MSSNLEKNDNIRVRFAPSPTGYLHVGGVRTALFNWLYARHNNGKFILRIEDTDRERSTKESVDMILEGLRYVGIDCDEGPFFQSDRTKIYQDLVDKLVNEGKAYKCYCTKEELDTMRSEAMANGLKPKYDGRCLNIKSDLTDKPFVIRFKSPREGSVIVSDLIRGEISFENCELDDLIIMRSDRSPTYNFVVVVDDATMNITHVIRGDDHIANTPRQANLYKGLGFTVPKFAHLPMILGSDKSRLSKRHGAASILEYKEMGYLPHAVINYLARLGWSHGDQEIFSKQELIDFFSFDHISNSPAVFNPEKLLWLNTHYIKNSSVKELIEPLKYHLVKEGITDAGVDLSCESFELLIKSLIERSKTLVDMAKGMKFYFKEVESYNEKGVKKIFKGSATEILSDIKSNIELLSDFTESSIHSVFTKLMEEKELKLGKIAQPVRLALTGTTVSPGIYDVMLVLGKDRVLKRLSDAILFIENKVND